MTYCFDLFINILNFILKNSICRLRLRERHWFVARMIMRRHWRNDYKAIINKPLRWWTTIPKKVLITINLHLAHSTLTWRAPHRCSYSCRRFDVGLQCVQDHWENFRRCQVERQSHVHLKHVDSDQGRVCIINHGVSAVWFRYLGVSGWEINTQSYTQNKLCQCLFSATTGFSVSFFQSTTERTARARK